MISLDVHLITRAYLGHGKIVLHAPRLNLASPCLEQMIADQLPRGIAVPHEPEVTITNHDADIGDVVIVVGVDGHGPDHVRANVEGEEKIRASEEVVISPLALKGMYVMALF